MSRRPAVRRQLDAIGSNYSADIGMVRSVWNGPGYHSRIPAGETVHETRKALDYALVLLEEGSDVAVARAQRAIDAVLALQDTDPTSATFGIWPWLYEEPLERMAPPDWNWADFCGIRLAHLLVVHGHRLESALRARATTGLRYAAQSIFRRNVGPAYTNIAIKGGVVCALAGEILDDVFLLHYGQRRLERVVGFSLHHGGYFEFNSPDYGLLVLTELERAALLAKAPRTRELVRTLHEFHWEQIALALQPGTGQLAGPQSRAYQDLLNSPMADHLEAALGFPLFRPGNQPGPREQVVLAPTIPVLPCPEPIRRKIGLRREQTTFVRHRFAVSSAEERCRDAFLWHAPDAALGSMNIGAFWVQQRPILGFWRVGTELAVLRVRMLRNGNDFATGIVRAVQDRSRVLALVGLGLNRGDHHDHLDRPADGVFRDSRLALEIAVQATDARVEQTTDDDFTIIAGDHAATVRPMGAWFGPLATEWRTFAEPGKTGIRLIFNHDVPFDLAPAALDEAGVGFELLIHPRTTPSPDSKRTVSREGPCIRLTSTTDTFSLHVEAPLKPAPLPAAGD